MTKSAGHSLDWRPTSKTRTQLSFVDVGKAYLNAKVDQELCPTFVELPKEDKDSQRLCGQLLRHTYGTRMAAGGWREEYSTMLLSFGFKQGRSCPNAFFHPERGIATSVHGGDFKSSGPNDALDWFDKTIGEAHEITIGPESDPAQMTPKRPEH